MHQIRQDMAENNAERSCSECPGGLHELSLADPHGLRADDPAERNPPGQTDSEINRQHSRFRMQQSRKRIEYTLHRRQKEPLGNQKGKRQNKQKRRHGRKRAVNPHDNIIRRSAEISGQNSESDSEQRCNQRCNHSDLHRGPSCEQGTQEHIPAEIIRPAPVFQRGWTIAFSLLPDLINRLHIFLSAVDHIPFGEQRDAEIAQGDDQRKQRQFPGAKTPQHPW